MLKPYMSDLVEKAGSRYRLVNIAAKRAREVADRSIEQGVSLDEKPVSIALKEIDDGTIKVYRKEED